MEKFQNLFSYRDLEDILQVTFGGIFSLDLKKRDKGSATVERKSKSFQKGRFTKKKSNEKRERNWLSIKENIYVWNVFHWLSWCENKERGEISLKHHSYILCRFFYKHYKKWYVCEDNSMLWYPKYLMGKYLALYLMIEEDFFSDTQICYSWQFKWLECKFCFFIKDACHIISVLYLLNSKQ